MNLVDNNIVKLIKDCIEKKNLSTTQELENLEWKMIFNNASQNRVLYAFCKYFGNSSELERIPHLNNNIDKILELGDIWQKRLQRSLEFVNLTLSTNDIDYLIVKTDRGMPYVTYDVDVLVKPADYNKVMKILSDFGELGKHPGKQSKKQVNFFGNDLLTIDIHKGFSWQGGQYIDEGLAWMNTREIEIANVQCPAPSYEVEFLLEMAHLLFERRYITLLDYLFIKRCCDEELDWSMILEQTKKYGWNNSFFMIAEVLNGVAAGLELKKELMINIEISEGNFSAGNPTLPYMLPVLDVFRIFMEKFNASKTLPKWDIAYYLFATIRYYIARKRIFPYYMEWAPVYALRWG